jgi:ABC-type bacteriocin/lantibiotic exporter with double-glycine peptidase domain
MRRLLVPETVQTSAMDCGPASLKTLLESFGIPASYGRLREACQTEVDGSSIDRIEETAVQLGLDAAQMMVPLDHLLLPEASTLPAMAVVRTPNGATHFVVVWRRYGRWLQVMDPAVGRRWTTCERFLADVYLHTQPIPSGSWREWAGTESFAKPLLRRLQSVGIERAESHVLVRSASADPGWHSLAALDAAARLVSVLVSSGAVARGSAASRLVHELVKNSAEIPETHWSVRQDPSSPDQVLLTGAVLVHVAGTKKAADNLSAELAAALEEKPSRPGLELLRLACADGLGAPVLLVTGLAFAAAGVGGEALLFRGSLDIGRHLVLNGQRMGAVGALLAFLLVMLLLELPLTGGLLRLGRKLECQLRVAFLRKIPRLGDRYFQSRLMSDMAERCHAVHHLRQVPDLAARLLRPAADIVCTVAGIAWLFPGSAMAAVLTALVSVGIPLVAQPLLAERDLRFRSHTGALARFYLDALLGLAAIRSHGGEQSIRRRHESLLAEWAHAGFGIQKFVTSLEGLQQFSSLAMAAWLVLSRLSQGSETSGLLLLVYWSLNLPLLGQELASVAWQYPSHRNRALRVLEPLGAKEEEQAASRTAATSVTHTGVAVRLEGVTVRAAGHTILESIDLELQAGDHVAIVGPSGAGKSSLAGLLLGWHRAAEGTVLVDGEPLDGTRLERLRDETAWVDPQVQLWNRSFFDNLTYGMGAGCSFNVDTTLEGADLHGVLRKLSDGLQTPLGEGGALVSGGEGQRIRMGRAMTRSGARLVILDEPGRGLDRERRRVLLDRARELWKDATLLCITHDIADTRDFPRVLVIERARIVEDGKPSDLASNPNSRYRALLDAEYFVRRGMWSHPKWLRLRIEAGAITEGEQEMKCA